MSTTDRNLGYYCLEMKYYRRKKDIPFFKIGLFVKFLSFINTDLSPQKKMWKNNNTNKSMGLDSYKVYKKGNNKFVEIIFKSCKFHHSPNYMSSDDGSERESDKEPNEGEKELTHVLCKEGRDELVIILEERRSGVPITSIVKYFNHFLPLFWDNNEYGENKKIIITYSRIPIDDLEGAIQNLTRICSSEIFTHKKILGSPVLGFLDEDDANMEDEIVVSCKVKRGESLRKRTGRKLYELAIAEERRVERVRIKGKDEKGVGVTIDTYFTKRKESVEVPVDELKGIVNSDAIFKEMEKLLLNEK